jgi:hypothetical protein
MKTYKLALTVKSHHGKIADVQREVLVTMESRRPTSFEFIRCVPIRKRRVVK